MFVKVLMFVFLFCEVKSSTHWIVTEDGRIQEKLESSFAMKRPDDLVSFIQQERTYESLKQTKEKLKKEQAKIDENEDRELHLEDQHYQNNQDCIKAGKKLADIDLFITSVLPLEHKDIEISDHIDVTPALHSEVHEPNCTSTFDLPYSVHAYDHVEGVQVRHLFPLDPVLGLKSTLDFLANPDDAAKAIHHALQKNSTSWVLYNLAAFYWRMKGNLSEAVECLRRALHFSPEHYKDVALVSLANILHRARYSFNATVIMHHALKVSDDYSINYFTLANMYASLGLYNESIKYYRETLKRQEEFGPARKNLAAVLCHVKLQEKLHSQHISLHRTLKELQDYKQKHEKFLRDQEHFMSLHLPATVLIERDMEFNKHLMKKRKSSNINSKFHVWANESGVYFSSLPGHPNTYWFDDDIELFYERPSPIQMTSTAKKNEQTAGQETRRRSSSKKKRRSSSMDKQSSTTEENTTSNEKEDELSASKEKRTYSYPDIYNLSDPSWPPPGACEKHVGKSVAWDEFPSAYGDPELRGFRVRSLITTDMGLVGSDMHPRPWNPPDCSTVESLESTPYDQYIVLDPAVSYFKQDTFLQRHLLTHVNDGYVWPEDLGQRILTALLSALKDKDDERLWVLYNLAGLYWRVNGDNTKAIECFRRCVHRVPSQHTDIPLISLSNIMYRMGKVNDAIHLLIHALKVNDSEPASYLSMGNALQARQNITGAIQFYSYATLLNPQYKEAFHGLLILKCNNLTRKAEDEPQQEATKRNPQDLSKEGDEEKMQANTDKKQADHSVSPDDTVDIMAKIDSKKTNLEYLLGRTDDLIFDLQNSNNGELKDKLLAAKDLLGKLERMQDSLGSFVDEAKATLELCEQSVSQVDFHFKPNITYLKDLDDVVFDPSKSDGIAPTCLAPTTNPLSDVNLNGVGRGPEETYLAEVLKVFLQTKVLSNTLRSGLLSFPTSRNLLLMTSFFWRISGNSQQALTCLLSSLSRASGGSRDFILYVISDYLAVLALYDEAVQVGMKLDESAHNRYLLASIYAAKGDFLKASYYYQQTIALNSNFADSTARYKAASCLSRT